MPCEASLELRLAGVAHVDEDIDEHDHVDVQVRMLTILDKSVQLGILRQKLRERGWKDNSDGTMSKQFGETTATLLADGSAVRITASAEASVEVTAEATAAGQKGEDSKVQAEADAAALRAAEAKLEREIEKRRKELVKKNADAILGVHDEVKKELESAVNEATKDALRQRASEIGTLTSEQERRDKDGNYELEMRLRT